MPVVLVAAGIALGMFAFTTGGELGHHLWVASALALLAFGALALFMWHRRQLAYIREQHLVIIGRYRNVHGLRPWPKACLDCGHESSDWRGCRDHDNAESSPCAKLLYAREHAGDVPDSLPNENWRADILGPRDRDQSDDKTAIGS